MTAQEVYDQAIYGLQPIERLRLANLILNGIVTQDHEAIDDRDDWSEQDQADIVHFRFNSLFDYPGIFNSVFKAIIRSFSFSRSSCSGRVANVIEVYLI